VADDKETTPDPNATTDETLEDAQETAEAPTAVTPPQPDKATDPEVVEATTSIGPVNIEDVKGGDTKTAAAFEKFADVDVEVIASNDATGVVVTAAGSKYRYHKRPSGKGGTFKWLSGPFVKE
jgi:hypothetical protein